MSPRSDLQLRLDLRRREIPLGGEIRYHLTLRNTGTTAAQIVSLYDNNRVTNIEVVELSVGDDGGPSSRLVGVFNHVSRQVLVGKVEVRTEDVRPLVLEPGAEEHRADNLCRYRWFDRPGRYQLRGLYQWGEIELWSDPVEIELVAAPLHALDQRWAYHYGDKFALHTAWVVRDSTGEHELFLRESLRFSPQVIERNNPVVRSPSPLKPRISVNRSLMAGGAVWLAWEAGGLIACIRTEQGTLAGGPYYVAPGLSAPVFFGAPITSDGGALTLLLLGTADDGAVRAIGIVLGPDGQEQARSMLAIDLDPSGETCPVVKDLTSVIDADCGVHLFWYTAGVVMGCQIDAETLDVVVAAQQLWSSQDPILSLCVPTVFGEDPWFAVVTLETDGHQPALIGTMGFVWLGLEPNENPLKREEMAWSAPSEILRASGELNTRGDLFVLVTSQEELRYVNAATLASKAIGATGDLFSKSFERLTVTSRDAVYLLANRRPYGLSEELVTTSEMGDEEEDE